MEQTEEFADLFPPIGMETFGDDNTESDEDSLEKLQLSEDSESDEDE